MESGPEAWVIVACRALRFRWIQVADLETQEKVQERHNALRYTHSVIYICRMILSFRDREAERLFSRFLSRKLPTDIQRVALRKLRMLSRATSLRDLRIPPANRLEKLHGDRSGQHSIRINDQWRICFVWHGHDAAHVEIVDYH